MGTPETLEIAGRYEGRSAPDPDVDRLRVMGANEYVAAALFVLGKVAVRQGDYLRARAHYEESYDLRSRLWSEEMAAPSLAGMGEVAMAQGDYETAQRC